MNVDVNGNTIRGFNEICYISPRIENVRLEDSSGTTTWDGITLNFNVENEDYYLKFNIIVDPEQLPLKKIAINWQDDEPDNPAALGSMNDNPNPDYPRTFMHRYDHSDSYDGIRIEVIDNWDISTIYPDDTYPLDWPQ